MTDLKKVYNLACRAAAVYDDFITWDFYDVFGDMETAVETIRIQLGTDPQAIINDLNEFMSMSDSDTLNKTIDVLINDITESVNR